MTDWGSSGRRFKSRQPDAGQRRFPDLLSIGFKEASASRRSRIARAWSVGIRLIEDAWAAVAFPDPGSVHADRTVVTQAAREMEMCASH